MNTACAWRSTSLEPLENRTLLAADLSVMVGDITLPTMPTPGDRGSVQVLLTNVGDAAAAGKVTINVYAQGSNVPLAGTTSVSISLAPGADARSVVVPITLPANCPAGTIHLKAQIVPDAAVGDSSAANNTDSDDDGLDVEWRFGTFGGRKNFVLKVVDGSGTPLTFSLKGGGYGRVVGGTAFTGLNLHETTTASTLSIATKTHTVIGGIVSDGPLKRIAAPKTDLNGDVTIDGSLGSLTVHDSIGETGITIGKAADGRAKVSFTFASVYDLSIASQMPIKKITAIQWRDTGGEVDAVVAPSLDSLIIKGDRANEIAGNFEAGLALGDMLLPGRSNAAGQVVGSYMGLNLLPQAFYFDGTRFIQIGTFGGPHSLAVSVNAAGQVVGMADTTILGQDTKAPSGHAFLFAGGVLMDLGTLGGDESTAFDINTAGVIVGQADTANRLANGDCVSRAFIYRNGVMTSLGSLGNGNSEATAINDSDWVVGRSRTLISGSEGMSDPYHAFLWRNGTMTDLGTLGGAQSWALDVNNSGAIVGWAETGLTRPDGSSISHAVLWQNGTAVDLGTLGGNASAAFGINDAGQIVGWSETSEVDRSGRPILHAFLYENGEMKDLGLPIVGSDQAVAYITIDNAGRVMGYTPKGDFLYENGTMSDLPFERTTPAAQALKSAKIAGSVGYSQWMIDGSAGSVKIGGAASYWSLFLKGNLTKIGVLLADHSAVAADGKIGTVTTSRFLEGRLEAAEVKSIRATGSKLYAIAGDFDAYVRVTGNTGTVFASGDMSGTWNGNAIKSVTVGGDGNDLTMRLRQGPAGKLLALGKIKVAGCMEGSSILTRGSIGSVTVGAVEDSAVQAGVSTAGCVDANSDGVLDLAAPATIDAAARIGSVKVIGLAGRQFAMVNSNFSAGAFGSVLARDAQTADGQPLFGFSGHAMAKMVYRDSQHSVNWNDGSVLSAPPPQQNFVVVLE